ncbi:PAS domain S-box protein [Desulfatibacillum aliphaticivorans]|uniref:PAS domain S-box protein n=1 Tax=Desulfatibacillum aliphaticivorans TaxID=218208 RepID=UPI0004101CD5|nr:PAS domain S-box protein [Desulfatibacillum aliphaticivorans]
MSPLSMPIAIAAALTMGSAIFHALVYVRQSARKEYLYFAIVCLLMVLYDIISLNVYNASYPEQATYWLKLRMLVLAPSGLALVWYLHTYTGHPDKRPVYFFTAYFSIAFIIGVFAPGGLFWTEQVPVLQEVHLPWFGPVTFYEFSLSSFGAFRYLIRVLFVAYFCWVTFWYLRHRSLRKGLAMIASFMVFFVGIANDSAVRLGLYDFIYIIEFSFMGVVMFMTWQLGNQVAEALVVRDQLEESERRYRLLAENISDNVWVVDMDMRFVYSSPSVKGLLGFEPAEVIGMSAYKIMTEEAFGQVQQELLGGLEENRLFPDGDVKRNLIIQLIRKDGTPIHTEIKAGFLYDDDRNPVGLVGITRDVEAQIVAEKALRESEEKYRRVYENIQDVYFEADLDGIIREVSPSIRYVTQYTREELIGRNIRSLTINPDERNDRLETIVSQGRINDYEAEFIDKDGSIVRASITAAFLFDEEGRPTGTAGTIRNIEDRKRAEEALQDSEIRFRLLAENSTDVIWTMSLGGAFTYISPSVERMSGFTVEEVMKMTLDQYLTPESWAKVQRSIARELSSDRASNGYPATLELQQYTKSGDVIDVEVTSNWILNEEGQPVGVRGATRDIRARKKAEREKSELEAQLLQARKMEAIGTLAGGIAHDFNNILHPIIGYTQMLMEEHKDRESTTEVLDEINRAAIRAKELVSQILTFGRRSSEAPSLVDLSAVVKESLSLLKGSIPSTIEVKATLPEADGGVFGNSSQLHQMVMNLCTNAYQAMKNMGGVMTIRLQKVSLNGDGGALAPNLPKGYYQKLSVSDTGPGMSKAVTERIFEPYFTTKDVGEGTGMGLAMVHSIVKSHKGEIRVHSKLNRGALFEVYLPAAPGACDEKAKPEVKEAPKGEEERILVVDDEPQTLRMTKRSLEKLGYLVHAEESSLAALDHFSNNPDSFDLILTDMTMPGLTGDVLAQKILAVRPDIPIILCTGCADAGVFQKEAGLEAVKFLQKPVDRQVLAQTIKEALSAGVM